MSGIPTKTISIDVILQDENLNDEENVEHDATPEQKEFIENAPGMLITASSVKDVKGSELEAMQEDFEKRAKELKDDIDKFKAEKKLMAETAKAKAEEAAKKKTGV